MFVFLVLLMLYPNDTLTGFAKAMKTCLAVKRYWRPLNLKRSLPVLKWTSESCFFLFFLSFKNMFADNYIIIRVSARRRPTTDDRVSRSVRDHQRVMLGKGSSTGNQRVVANNQRASNQWGGGGGGGGSS